MLYVYIQVHIFGTVVTQNNRNPWGGHRLANLLRPHWVRFERGTELSTWPVTSAGGSRTSQATARNGLLRLPTGHAPHVVNYVDVQRLLGSYVFDPPRSPTLPSPATSTSSSASSPSPSPFHTPAALSAAGEAALSAGESMVGGWRGEAACAPARVLAYSDSCAGFFPKRDLWTKPNGVEVERFMEQLYHFCLPTPR